MLKRGGATFIDRIVVSLQSLAAKPTVVITDITMTLISFSVAVAVIQDNYGYHW